MLKPCSAPEGFVAHEGERVPPPMIREYFLVSAEFAFAMAVLFEYATPLSIGTFFLGRQCEPLSLKQEKAFEPCLFTPCLARMCKRR